MKRHLLVSGAMFFGFAFGGVCWWLLYSALIAPIDPATLQIMRSSQGFSSYIAASGAVFVVVFGLVFYLLAYITISIRSKSLDVKI